MNDLEDVILLMNKIKIVPGFYIGKASLERLNLFLRGYIYARGYQGVFEGFNQYIAELFHDNRAVTWAEMIGEKHGDMEGFFAFFDLFEKYARMNNIDLKEDCYLTKFDEKYKELGYKRVCNLWYMEEKDYLRMIEISQRSNPAMYIICFGIGKKPENKYQLFTEPWLRSVLRTGVSGDELSSGQLEKEIDLTFHEYDDTSDSQ